MARQLRIHPPGGFHHVTARGNNKLPIYADDEDRHGFLRILSAACKRGGCDLVAYCLMTNHVHLTLLDHHGNLSDVLRHVKGVYAQRFNQRHGRTGHLFEGRFWNSLLETDSYLAVAVEYVHRNPVEAGLVSRPEDYCWSSYQEYLGLRPSLDVLDTKSALALYGNDLDLLRTSTESQARDSIKEAELAKRRPAPALGSDGFKQRMKVGVPVAADTASSRRRTERKRFRPEIDLIVAIVAAVHGVEEELITTSLIGHHNEARSAAMSLSRNAGWPAKAIAEGFGLSSANSVSMAARRFEAVLERDSLAQHRLALVRRRLAVRCEDLTPGSDEALKPEEAEERGGDEQRKAGTDEPISDLSFDFFEPDR